MARSDPSRRRVLAGIVGLPIVAAAAAATARLGAHAATLRPHGSGTSDQRCGQCGGRDHSMLAASCPVAPRVVRG